MTAQDLQAGDHVEWRPYWYSPETRTGDVIKVETDPVLGPVFDAQMGFRTVWGYVARITRINGVEVNQEAIL